MMSFLSYFVAKATLIFAAALIVTLLMHRASAAARHFIWICALAAALALPVLSLALPDWNLRVPTPAATSAARAVLIAPAAALGASDEARETTPVQATRSIPWALSIWLAGALIALARLAAGHLRMAVSLHRARNADGPGWAEGRDEASTLIGLRRIVALKISGETDVPLTCGVFSAAVVLPEASKEWDADRRRVVLLHELTHARRRDPLLWFIAQVAGAVYWFHPLAWLAVSRFRREQERSCDDAVVRAGAVRWAYAEHLVGLARSIAPMRAYAAALHMAATSDLEQRVRALLDPSRSRQGLRQGVCIACAAGLLAAILPLAAVHAQDAGPAATLSGSVHDPSGAVVPDVLILLKKDASHHEAARANASGEYKFSVPAGSYTMIIRASGFAEFQKAVVLPADSKTNITLAVGQVSESMEVVGKAPPPQSQPAGTPHRIRVGGNVQATKLMKMVKPAYPPGAEAAGIEGTVLLRAVISTGGDLLGLSAMNASVDAELAQAAMEAARQWHYQPTLLNGQPVEVVTTIAITFRLER